MGALAPLLARMSTAIRLGTTPKHCKARSSGIALGLRWFKTRLNPPRRSSPSAIIARRLHVWIRVLRKIPSSLVSGMSLGICVLNLGRPDQDGELPPGMMPHAARLRNPLIRWSYRGWPSPEAVVQSVVPAQAPGGFKILPLSDVRW